MPRLGTGIGWRPEIADAVEAMSGIDWVEAVAENVCTGHLPESLLRLRERGVTVIPHGVSLGLGGAERPDPGRLAALAERVTALGAPLVTEHIAFVRAGGELTASPPLEAGHLLPVPRTRDALDVLCENVRIAQEALPVPLAVENIAALFSWPGEELTEGQFLSELVERTGVRLLVDVANLHTNHVNRGEDPAAALAALPVEAIAYVHVAGGVERDGVWHDSHAHPVPRAVLDILTDLASRVTPPGVLLERDDDFPEPAELEGELNAIRAALTAGKACSTGPGKPGQAGAPPAGSEPTAAGSAPATGGAPVVTGSPADSGDGPASRGQAEDVGPSRDDASTPGDAPARDKASTPGEAPTQGKAPTPGNAPARHGAPAVSGEPAASDSGAEGGGRAGDGSSRAASDSPAEGDSQAGYGGSRAEGDGRTWDDNRTGNGPGRAEGGSREAGGSRVGDDRAEGDGTTGDHSRAEGGVSRAVEGSRAEPDGARRPDGASREEYVGPVGTVGGAGGEEARQRLGVAQAAVLSSLVAGTPVPEGFDRARMRVQARALAAKRAGVVAKVAPELPAILGDGYRAAFLEYARSLPMSGGYRRDALDFAGHLLKLGRPADPAVRRELRDWWLHRAGPAPRPRGLAARARVLLRRA
ncbi:DUF692 family multinuclear iron-containing protein [Streptomyces sp. NPDC048720]|uniref:multinuclear nonheme iron-dependent oxidase n=1 Tax=Streptomyces sp. NPDC048720 TaxID=3365588 RepID=UPI00371632F9